MIRKYFAAILCCALCIPFLAACGGNPKDIEAGKQAFSGTWILYEIQSDDDDAASHDDIQGLRDTGKECKLYLNEDGRAVLDLFGAVKEGTWEPQTENTAILTFGNSNQEMNISDGKLSMQSDDDILIFEVGSEIAPVAEGNVAEGVPAEGESPAEGDANAQQ